MIDHPARALEVNDATYAAWNAHDPDAVAAVFAEDAVVHDAGSDELEIGRSARVVMATHQRELPWPC
jgi:hypothetical protein